MKSSATAFVLGLVVALVLWVVLQRRATREVREARARGKALAKTVWAAHQAMKSQDAHLSVEERRVRALFATGRSEEDVRELVAKNTALSPLHATLTMCTVGIAAQAERDRAVGPDALRKNILAVQRAVMDVIPMDA